MSEERRIHEIPFDLNGCKYNKQKKNNTGLSRQVKFNRNERKHCLLTEDEICKNISSEESEKNPHLTFLLCIYKVDIKQRYSF